ncbi:MAG: bifunctional YncE family protein/alkaline phosphatase family protein [Acidobacteria bacterium]|nr:bifunctional YncE family protein/alkaline phosphatase family protein [Acidobacteriota bacterium]
MRLSGSRYLLLMGVTLSLFTLSIVVMKSEADIQITNNPASEGRTISPAGSLVLDVTTRQPAVGALPVDFVRSPDSTGADQQGRYLVAVNSGFGIQFNAATNRAQQSLAVIDLNAKPAPAVIQNVYFPMPQSVNVGVVFDAHADANGAYPLYVAGGFENKIWMFKFKPEARFPITPTSAGPDTQVTAPFLDLTSLASEAATPRYNDEVAPVYPTGLALSPDGDTLFVANNLADSLGIVSHLRGEKKLSRVDLHRDNKQAFIYPYGVVALPASNHSSTAKVYVSCWSDASIAVVDPRHEKLIASIAVGYHPTAMLLNAARTRLYVVNSNADSVSVINTASDKEVERINVKLAESQLVGSSPESLALSADGATLYVANAHSNAVAVVALAAVAQGASEAGEQNTQAKKTESRSRVRGFLPTGQYPSAVAVANHQLFIGNGKGTGFEPSSLVVNNSGRVPNLPNDRFPTTTGRSGRGGQYSVSLASGNLSVLGEPDERQLAQYTQAVMRNNNLIGQVKTKLFRGASPIKHIIYIIKENRTYDQLFGDVKSAGNGQAADGDEALAIFGAGNAAQVNGQMQNITPNQRALALRFGLLDRFFVNAEASPDGHNWSTAAFSNDYVDKAYRWDYSGRGRTYDYEGFNRLPSLTPNRKAAPYFNKPIEASDLANVIRRYIPYLNGSRDVGEPETLYLWDAVKRAKLSYRNYGEFVVTLSKTDVDEVNANRAKSYPDLSPTVSAFPTKQSLEGNHSLTFRNFDMNTPDAMTVDSYRAAKETNGKTAAMIYPTNPEEKFRGTSRLSAWLEEFNSFVADLQAGKGDRLPNFSTLRFPNDHTSGLAVGKPSPQFYVAENDYAVGRLVEAVSNSPYWKDTAIFIVEDDAQDGPDHVDAHRSPALIISAYNKPGALVHDFHNTVSLIRTMEILLGLEPMNQLDATAAPIDMFQERADLKPFTAMLPDVALTNLLTPVPTTTSMRYWMQKTGEQDLAHADMAEARVMNEIIWFSVRGQDAPMPPIARLPLFDAMREGLLEDDKEKEERADQRTRNLIGKNGASRKRLHDADE